MTSKTANEEKYIPLYTAVKGGRWTSLVYRWRENKGLLGPKIQKTGCWLSRCCLMCSIDWGNPGAPLGRPLKGEISGNYLWGNSSRVPEKFEFLMRSPILPITTPLAYLRGYHFFNLVIYSPPPGSSSNTTLFEYKTRENKIDFLTIIAKRDSLRGPTPIICHREMTFFTRTKEKLFLISPVPYPQDRTKSPSLKNWTCLGSFPRDAKR